MINFLRKYWFKILVLLVLTMLLLYFIPHEESRYLQQDADAVRKSAVRVLLYTIGILFSAIYIFGLVHLRTWTDFFYITAGVGMMALTFYFVFNAAFLSGAFLLNKLKKNALVEKVYTVVYTDTASKALWLKDTVTEKPVQADQLFTSGGDPGIKTGDTLVVSFTNGLLGFNFDPQLKEVKTAPRANSNDVH